MRNCRSLPSRFRSIHVLLWTLVVSCLPFAGQSAAPEKLELRPDDHVVLVGNALADRFQHSGHFEALVHAKHPWHRLVFRNLAVSGDEVAFRHRSDNFGTPDDWLGKTGADIVLGFFGYNESFKGEAGLEKFRADLAQYIQQTRSRDYSGKGPPRIVLFSPIATERHPDPNFQAAYRNNANLALYSAAIAEVAASHDVQFVDLFTPSQRLFEAAAGRGEALTINGFLLKDEGDRQLAPIMYESLFGEAPSVQPPARLREAINEKNAQWHARYRTIDGYNVYGGRSQLVFDGVTNYKVMQEEMSVRDVLTANRDLRVWAVAQGGELEVDDSNLPAVTRVGTNKPGPNPDGSHVFLSGEEAIDKMTLHSGMSINLFASEDEFPELANPVQMAWDTKGRLWVAVWPNYPGRSPDSRIGDSLLIFEDTNGDGRADKVTNFIDDLNAPTGFQFFQDGVLVIQAPDVWFIRDTNGDGKADWKERVLMGLDSADSHHTANAICIDPGGAIYLSDGVFHRTQIETPTGVVRNNDGGIYRYMPQTAEFETYVSYGFANPHGKVFDRWGNDFITDATGNNTYFGPAISGFLDYPAKHPGIKQFWDRPSRPCPATGILSSRHFPDEFQGNFLNLNVIGFLGVFRVGVSEESSGLKGETLENIISSTDPNFRPIDISMGPDGAMYLLDWHNPIIGHMQHHLRDPSRDAVHGRIYRITHDGRPLLRAPQIHGAPIPALLELLKEPENGTRQLAKVELGGRNTSEVIAATQAWLRGLDRTAPEYEHHLMEGLWVHQWQNVVDVPLLRRMLQSPKHEARAAATRVLCYWRDRVPDAMGMLMRLAADPHPRVRLEAVRAASFFKDARAADIALASLQQPTDYYLDYVVRESLRQLEPWWRQAIAEGRPVAANNPAGINYLIGRVSTQELLKLPRTLEVLEALLLRGDAADGERIQALAELATASGKTEVEVLVAAIQKADGSAATGLARLLTQQSPVQLRQALPALRTLANESGTSGVRASAWAGIVVAHDSFTTAWDEAKGGSEVALSDLLSGLPQVLDPGLRSQAFDRALPLIEGQWPAGLDAAVSGTKAVEGRFVRIELPRRGTLTLAEVQVFSEGQNVALKGTARQSSTAYSGDAGRAIDGKTDGTYASNSQTHTNEDENNPWWEVDLGGNLPIESIAIWNRSENGGVFVKRLDGFTLRVLDAGRREVYRIANQPAPPESVRFELSRDLAGLLQRAAMRAAVSFDRGQDRVFEALAGAIADSRQIATAAQSVRVLPRSAWTANAAGRAAAALLKHAQAVPEAARTSQEYVEIVQTAEDLAGALSPEAASRLRRQLREVRVAVHVVRTVREQMRYDTPRIVVEAGKPFELIIENDDFMPHNLVIVTPGSRPAIGTMADAMRPDQRDRQGRAYVPRSDQILAATKLLESGQREVLRVTAPTEEGEYEYVCTFPGHWPVMWGRLVVTRDVEVYLLANPVAKEIVPDSAEHHDH